jgi:DNA-binding GntR family transcriptional regulator
MEGIASAAASNYRTVEEMVVAAVREAIVSGVYKPGEKLPQEQLAQSLGVSRIPVRAGLRKLEAEGLVVFYPHRGATVRRLEVSEVAEIYDLRILLETFALKSAIENVTPAEVEELSSLADQLDEPGEGQDWLELRQEFYRRLYTIAGRPRTADLIAKLRADVGRYWLEVRVVDHGKAEHRVIIDAVRARDSKKAEAWMAQHLTKVSLELQRRIAELYAEED